MIFFKWRYYHLVKSFWGFWWWESLCSSKLPWVCQDHVWCLCPGFVFVSLHRSAPRAPVWTEGLAWISLISMRVSVWMASLGGTARPTWTSAARPLPVSPCALTGRLVWMAEDQISHAGWLCRRYQARLMDSTALFIARLTDVFFKNDSFQTFLI